MSGLGLLLTFLLAAPAVLGLVLTLFSTQVTFVLGTGFAFGSSASATCFFCRLVLTYGLYPLEEQLIVPQHHIFCCVLVLDEGVSCWVILCPMMHCCWTTAPEAGSPISLVYNYETVPVYVNLRKYGPRAK